MANLAENQNTDDMAEEDLAEEEQMQAELEANQELYAAQAEAEELHNQGQEFRHPSYFKYLVLLAPLALTIDGIDIFTEISGLGIPFGRIISFAATTVMLLIFWFTDTKQKSADDYVKDIEKKAEVITQRIANAERQIVRVARLSRKMPGAKQAYRKFHLATIRKGRIALKRVVKTAKSPISRYAAAGALNLVPILAVLPWQLIGVYLSYRAEKESYKNAQEASESVMEAAGETATA